MSSEPRLASPGEGATVLDLVRRAFEHYVPRIGSRPRPMDEDYGEFARRGELWVLGDPIAAALVLQDADDHLWLDVVAVEPSHQGAGLGGKLLRFAEEEATRRGHSEVRLLTHELMSENRAIYGEIGYEEYDRRGEPGDSLVFLRKRLGG
ncbi:MAG TPA: GNAT family N-acetyltransferase [Solirubrobacterales bacterium]|nr:GNAT family N-acetyltransferase [Solirubrobacterales bacterium]